MGRTTATYRDRLRRQREEWAAFERALRRRDREAYDRLWAHAHATADAAGAQNPGEPTATILLSIVLAQERERAALADRVANLETRLDDRTAGED
jgi:hypothetical protein